MKSKTEIVRKKKYRSRKAAIAVIVLFTFSFLLSSCGSSRGAVPAGASAGSCPVCHMKVKASDDWTAEIHYRDGSKLMFETPGDMLAFYTAPDQYDVDAAHKDLSAVERLAVKDYQSKRQIDARQAAYVYRSRIEGPMGPEFIPFESREAAETFIVASGGQLLSLGEVTREMVREVRK